MLLLLQQNLGPAGNCSDRARPSLSFDPPAPAARERSVPPAAQSTAGECFYADSEADIPSTEVSGAICVQRFDDSRNSAIHTTYRTSLRSSSLREPRHPLLGVFYWLFAQEPPRGCAGRDRDFLFVNLYIYFKHFWRLW